ncbi:MAG: alpha/beta hydrolase [Ignavibacteria bacterium]|nr:alpha/beta hydrolase [Ignavibacteria bacterium]
MKEINVLGNKVFDYEGSGEPLIFVHSFPLNSRMWDRQAEYFKKSFRVITYDLRGMGGSTSTDYVFTMEKLVNDFFHIINNLKIDRVHACGLSMGGYILLRSVIKDESRFHSLAVVNTKPEKDSDDELLRRSNAVIKIKSGGRNTYIGKLIKKLVNTQDGNLLHEIEDIIGNNTDDGICGNLLALSTRTNTYTNLDSIKTPVLLISAEKDEITPPGEIEKIYKTITSARSSKEFAVRYTLDNCGHLCNMENPVEFNKILEWFLKCIDIKKSLE